MFRDEVFFRFEIFFYIHSLQSAIPINTPVNKNKKLYYALFECLNGSQRILKKSQIKIHHAHTNPSL